MNSFSPDKATKLKFVTLTCGESASLLSGELFPTVVVLVSNKDDLWCSLVGALAQRYFLTHFDFSASLCNLSLYFLLFA